MLSAVLTSLLLLPIAPLNPIEQDTLATDNLQFAIGLSTPNGILDAGPSAALFYEYRPLHPWIVRAGVEYRYGEVSGALNPNGELNSYTFSLEGFYYRGSGNWIGYIGGGGLLALNSYNLGSVDADSLFAIEGVTDVEMSQSFGYRILLGLRYKTDYAIEIRVSEVRPDFIFETATGPNSTRFETRQTKTSTISLSFGYILPLNTL